MFPGCPDSLNTNLHPEGPSWGTPPPQEIQMTPDSPSSPTDRVRDAEFADLPALWQVERLQTVYRLTDDVSTVPRNDDIGDLLNPGGRFAQVRALGGIVVAGEHVHTHNVASSRGRGDIEPGASDLQPRLAEPADDAAGRTNGTPSRVINK